MARPLSNDLRERVVAAVCEGASCRVVAGRSWWRSSVVSGRSGAADRLGGAGKMGGIAGCPRSSPGADPRPRLGDAARGQRPPSGCAELLVAERQGAGVATTRSGPGCPACPAAGTVWKKACSTTEAGRPDDAPAVRCAGSAPSAHGPRAGWSSSDGTWTRPASGRVCTARARRGRAARGRVAFGGSAAP